MVKIISNLRYQNLEFIIPNWTIIGKRGIDERAKFCTRSFRVWSKGPEGLRSREIEKPKQKISNIFCNKNVIN